MALRGFRCSNCHTWFEGEGNHPRCPLCGTRASPRDLLDNRESERPVPQPVGGWEFEPPDFEMPDLDRAVDFELPTRDATDYEVPMEQAPDYEAPREVFLPESRRQGSGYDEVRHHEAPSEQDASWGEEWSREDEAPAGQQQSRPREQSGGSWGDRIGPIIGALIFVAILLSNVCRALTDSD